MHRGKQYRRAIQLYYRKFHAYPPNVDALVKTNEIRFLRKKYIDPMTGKDDWKPILYGQNKTRPHGLLRPAPAGGAAPSPASAPAAETDSTARPRNSAALRLRRAAAHRQLGRPADPGSGTATHPAGRSGRRHGSDSGHNWHCGPSGIRLRYRPTGQTFGGAGIIGFCPPAPNSPSWSTRRRTTTTSGSLSTIRSPK